MELDRRDLLRAGLAGAGALAVPTAVPSMAGAAARRRREGLVRGGSFPTGVLSGSPTATSAVLLARVDGLERAGNVVLEVATDPGFRRVVRREVRRAAPVRDFVVQRAVTGLRPQTEYFYRFATATQSSPVGRLRTLPPPDSRTPVRIGFFSCQKFHQGYFTAHRGLAADDDLDLVVSLGDYVYEEPVREALVPERRDTVGALGDGDCQSLAEYRAKYRLYQGDEDLRAMHAKHPVVAIWDDHEAEDDYAGETEGDPLRPRRVPFLERRRAGYLSFFEHLPMPRLRADPFRLFRSLRVGQAEVFLLDTRQYRDPLACRPQEPCPEGNAPGRSLLGRAQREWLLDGLAASSASWKVLANQVMMMSLDVGTPGAGFNADQWDGYSDERRVLTEGWLARGVRDVTVITGDIHTFFAGQVTTTGRLGGRAAATEFVGGSITSTGLAEALAPTPPAAIESGLIAQNPHLTYVDSVRRGYGVLELSAEELRCTFRAPETVLRPGAPVRDLARFRVARGSTAVERA
jgi:alkaline phosphatase D